MGNLCRGAHNIVGKKDKKVLYVILNYMKPINLFYLIRELIILILISVVTLTLLILFSIYATLSGLGETIKRGIECAFGRNITSIGRSG